MSRPAVVDRRLVALVLAAVLATVGLSVCTAPAAQADSATLYTLLNQSRQASGLPALVRDSRLDAVAQSWTRTMVSSGMRHNPSYSEQIPSGWTRAGENVASGYRTDSALHQAWMNSAGHKANILGAYTSVGIGWVKAADGGIWATQVFAAYPGVRPPAAPAAVAPAPAQSTTSITAGPPQATTLATFSTTARTAQLRRFSTAGMATSQDLGGGVSGAPSVVNRGGALEVYVRGTNDRMYVTRGEGASWSAWSQVPAGVVTSAPSAVVRNGTVDVFYRDARGRVAQVRSTSVGAFATVAGHGGAVLAGTGPAVTVAGGGVQVSVVGTDRRVYTMRPGEYSWKNLGGAALGISTVTGGAGTHVVVRGTNNQVYAQRIGTGAWRALRGITAAVPRAGLDAAGKPVSVVLGTNGSLYVSSLESGSGWTRVS